MKSDEKTRHPALSDGRYTITLEYCGYTNPRHVLRFCGDWVNQSETRQDAERALVAYHNKRTAF